MAALSSYMPTLVDITRILDPNGSIGSVAEILQEYNEILEDIPWYEGNLPTGHQLNIRTSKPTPTFRLLNQGVVPAKSTTGQIVEGCAILEARSHIDKDVAELNGNTAAFRLSQDRAFIESLGDTLSTALIYGDISTNPEQFNGLSSRYWSLSGETTSAQVLTCGDAGSSINTSIWLVAWAPDKAFGIYPKGTKAGLQHEDLGIQEVITSTTTGATMRAYVSWFQWKCGLAIGDYHNVVRICNIDTTALLTAGDSTDTSANVLKGMSRALDLLPPGASRPVFYMNQRVRSMLRVKMQDKSNLHLRLDELMGPSGVRRNTLTFQGVPCRRVDSILNTEAALT